MKKKILSSLIVMGLSATLIGGATFAWFSDSAANTTNTFTAGTLSIDNSKITSVDFSVGGLIAPGDSITDEVKSIDIVNNGNLNLATVFRFFPQTTLNSDGTNASVNLSDAIVIDSMKMEFKTPGNNTWATADEFIKDGVGSPTGSYYDGYKDAAFGNKITLSKFLTNNGMLPGGLGWQMGALKPGYSYRLSFNFKLAGEAGNAYQGVTQNIQFKAFATQINADAIDEMFRPLGITDLGASHTKWFNDQIADQTES